MKQRITMRAALADGRLLGNALAGLSWTHWRALLIAAMGERLYPAEREIFKRFTGRLREPGARIEEALFLIGRRGGKDRAAAVIAAYLAALVDWSAVLARGEIGLVLCVGADVRQATVQRDYIEGVFDSSPMLRKLISNRTADSIELTNGISIEVRAASFRRLRGVTCVAVIATEAAFWQTDESSNPDTEILNAVRPSLATTGGPVIIITTPYARRGEVWNVYRQHFGANGDPLVLVAQGASTDFNPTLPQRVIDRAMERDAAAAGAEYLAQFRADIEGFVSREAIEGAVIPDRHELLPMSGVSYVAYADPSGGSSDSFTIAVAHAAKDGRAILDALRERRPPFSPDGVVREFAELLRSYGIRQVTGDRYAGEWPRERFRAHGIEYMIAEKSKSDLYRDLLPLLNSGRVELLDLPRLASQLCALERRTARSGKDSIDHAPGAHDDVANACAGSLLLAAAAAPSLWQAESFPVVNGTAARANLIFATLVIGEGGTVGVAYFAASLTPRSSLILLDLDRAALSPVLLKGMAERLADFGKTLHARGVMIYTQTPLKSELERLGVTPVEAMDFVLADPLLNVAAAVHVGSNRVRLCAEVLAKNYPLGFLHGSTAQTDDDPLTLAVLAGVVLMFDKNRNATKPRAA
jgi:hypothetical protein